MFYKTVLVESNLSPSCFLGGKDENIGLWVMHAVCCHHLSNFDIYGYFTEIPDNDIETIGDDRDS